MTMFKVTIEGVTPLLCHRFTETAQQEASKGSRTAVVGGSKGTPREQAETHLYLGIDGKTLVIPGPNLYRSFVDAGAFFKAGKSKVTTQKTSLLLACLSLEELDIPIQHREPWDVDSRPIVMPSTGGRILRHRPRFNDWRLSFTLTLDTNMMAASILREIVDAAGKQVGLGDFRPGRKGPFGKFVVVEWKEVK